MGVYINMEMPKSGSYEAVIVVLDKSTAEIAISPAEDDIGYWKEYPLIPVPPHGDLIDRDALIRNHTIDQYDWSEVIDVEDIRNAPTVIEAEEGE